MPRPRSVDFYVSFVGPDELAVLEGPPDVLDDADVLDEVPPPPGTLDELVREVWEPGDVRVYVEVLVLWVWVPPPDVVLPDEDPVPLDVLDDEGAELLEEPVLDEDPVLDAELAVDPVLDDELVDEPVLDDEGDVPAEELSDVLSMKPSTIAPCLSFRCCI